MGFASDLMMLFFQQAGVDFDNPASETVSWKDVQGVFYESADQIRKLAVNSGRVWSPAAPILLDRKLIDFAISGQSVGIGKIPHDLTEELWRRWSWAIIGASLEERHGRPLDLLVPGSAPAEVRGWGVVLYVLAGPGRDYRRDMKQL